MSAEGKRSGLLARFYLFLSRWLLGTRLRFCLFNANIDFDLWSITILLGLPGDHVVVAISPYDLSKGRITRRLKEAPKKDEGGDVETS